MSVTECPRCNSPQKFPRLLSKPEADSRIRHAYIRCTVCWWESDLGRTTDEIEKFQKKSNDYLALARKQVRRRGSMNSRTRRQWTQVLKKLNALRNDLEEQSSRSLKKTRNV